MNDRLSLRPGAARRGRRPTLVPSPVIPLPMPQRVERRGSDLSTGTIATASVAAEAAPAPTESRSAQSLRMLVESLHRKLDELAHMTSAIYNDMLETRARIERIESYLAGDEHALDESADEEQAASIDADVETSADPAEADVADAPASDLAPQNTDVDPVDEPVSESSEGNTSASTDDASSDQDAPSVDAPTAADET